MSKILHFAKPGPFTKLAKTTTIDSANLPLKIEEEREQYETDEPSSKLKFPFADDNSLYAYYQLSKHNSLARGNRLQHVIATRKITAFTSEELLKNTQDGTVIFLSKNSEEQPQRLVNRLSPSTYLQPHKYATTDQWKLITWLSGSIEILFFDQTGVLLQRLILAAEQHRIVEIPATLYHTIIAHEISTYLEVHNGYKSEDKIAATWAPADNSPHALKYLKFLYTTEVGRSAALEELDY